MLKLNLVLSLISFIPLLLIIIWGGLVEKFMAMRWTNRQKEFDRLYDFTQENFTGIRVIKAFVKGTNEIHTFAKIARKNQDTNIDFVKISVLFDVIISLLIAAIMAIILGFGGWFAYSTAIGKEIVIFGQSVNLEAGELVTFLGYFESIVWPMMALGQIVSMLSRASASLKRISHFLDEDEEIKNNPNSYKLEDVKGKITFKNYSFEYPGSKQHSLDNISFEINPGETIGVIGKIGSGKTTLVNSLLRLYNVEPNTIFIDDHDIMDCDINSVRESISYVPQDNFLFSDKIRNNIAFSNRGIDFARIKKAAQFADVDENISCFQEGYDTLSGERGVSLSGGQKQRISIARVYIKEAPIMIMDDSVSAVDVKTEENILKKY
ncbi:MAG: ABC transporter ATP-binding protein/permease [Clostridium sp.]|nr:MAG: ABC transporter ATP-binding protein/permease [Clostridium sp.]